MRLLVRGLGAALAVAIALSAASPSLASAAGVAYLDGKEVWASTLDGTQKVRLSAGEGDWSAVAQSDQGYVVGVRAEPGKAAQYSSFTIWNPNGTQKDFGPLAGLNSGGINVWPLSLDITADGGLLVYGFSNFVQNYPGSTLTTGFYLLPSSTRISPVGGPYSVIKATWPTLVGNQVIGAVGSAIAVQDAGSTASATFNPWIETAGTGGELRRSDVSSSGRVVASEIYFSGATPETKIVVVPTDGLGLSIRTGDCWLPAQGEAADASVSNDGSLVAWGDAGGVKLAGVPDFSGADPCTLTRAPIVISPTGSWPSLGPIDVPGVEATRNPPPVPTKIGVPSGSTLPSPVPPPSTIAPATTVTSAALGKKSGATVQVFSAAGGKATVTLTVLPKVLGKKGKKPIVIAEGSADLPAGSATTARSIKLKATKAGKKHLKRLKKKKATLTLVIGGQTITTQIVKLK